MTTTKLRGLALLDAVIAQIETHPETWRQEKYRCETGMCVAGWAAEMTGGQWLHPASGRGADWLAAEAYDKRECVFYDNGTPCVDAEDRAAVLLGLDDYDQIDHLFAADNDLADIRRIRYELAGRWAS